MRRNWLLLLLIPLLMIIFPTSALAIDFTITDSHIDVYLQENGEVYVEETFIYEFDDDFNGMIRQLIPAKETTIANFEAFEGERPLTVEQDASQYRIYRSGEHETVTFTLTYTIIGAVDVYADLATFAWAFFDEHNETPYTNFTISVYPPNETSDVLAYGTDKAFEKETIQTNGSVLFELGTIDANEDGSVYVAFDSALFPSASATSSNTVREDFLNEKEALMIAAEKKKESQENLFAFSSYYLPIMIAIAISLLLYAYIIKKKTINEMHVQYAQTKEHPKEVLSLPATIYFTNYSQLPPEAIAATLLDLVRKGAVREEKEGQFTLIQTEDLLKQEKAFVDWLFKTIGNGETFALSEMDSYSKNTKNRESFMKDYQNWIKAVKEETKVHPLIDSKSKTRIFSLIVGLSTLPLLVMFPMNGMALAFIITLFLSLYFIFFSIFYSAKTVLGEEIVYEWKQFQEQFLQTPQEQWSDWEPDKLKQAIIYNLGTKNKKFMKTNDKLVETFKNQGTTTATSNTLYSHGDILAYAYLGAMISQTTRRSSDALNVDSSGGSSSYTGGGSGAGGSGGGNGAF
ncbi:DUF2207 domain-containing protein [Alkalihalobacillus sp. 1P02AB]|uniref:DUF2207 domain-containing protein n=1 Tax=Alkalihalobacillus sp. 1P02AB TaxID=3132260 RepID=UPI0039A48D2C